jgi:hypothetical protein
MANVFTKAPRFVRTSLGLLVRDTVLAHHVWRNPGGDFRGVAGEVISVKLPAFGVARKRAIRGGGNRQASYLAQRTVSVTLTDNVYMRTPLEDAELTLDVESFERDIIAPQIGGIISGIEDEVVDEIEGANYAGTHQLTYDQENPAEALFDASEVLTKSRVPNSMRELAVGTTAKKWLLQSDQLIKADQAGDNSALRRAEVGQIAGYTAFEVPGLHPEAMYAYHRSAFVLSNRAPVVPPDVQGAVDSFEGFAIRIAGITDSVEIVYNAHADVYLGTNHVQDHGTQDEHGRFVPSDEPDLEDGTDLLFVRAVQLMPEAS